MRTVRVIVLAAQRPGVVNALAEAHGVSHKCLVPLAGKPLIAHVLATLGTHPGVGDIVVSVEPELFDAIRTIRPGITCVAARPNLADSVFAASEGATGAILITTADHALLTSQAIDAMLDAIAGADVAIAFASKGTVLTAHPDGQRNFYRFADDSYANCNLYALGGTHALNAAEAFRGGGQFMKKAGNIVATFGLFNLLLFRLHIRTLAQGMERLSKRIGLKIAPVVLADGRNAIDVDNARTYRVVSELLASASAPAVRSAQPLPKAA